VKGVKVLHVHRDFAPDQGGGGVARHIHGLATVAASLGLAVRVVAPRALPAREPGTYEVRPCGLAGLWREVGWAEAVHVHGSRNPIAAVAGLIGLVRGKRLIYTPHCYYDDGSWLKRMAKRCWDRTLERLLLRRSDTTVLLALFWLDELRRRGFVVSSPVIMPNCVLAQSRLARPAAAMPLQGEPALLSLGRLDAVKRLDDAIAALREPGLEHAVLHVAGTGPDRARLEAAARQAGVAGRVIFHGFVPDETAAAMAAGADCFLLTSGMEGGPTVLIEMMLMGRPLVASDIPGNREILAATGSEAGLYPLGDVAELARTVCRAVAGMPTSRIAAAARARFTWEPRAAEIAALYAGPASDGNRSGMAAP
jgi:glycosyltransferase involved in cell wall biosynthesis